MYQKQQVGGQQRCGVLFVGCEHLGRACVFDLLSTGTIRAEFPTAVLRVGYVWSIVFRVCILEDVSCETRRNHNTTSLKSVHFSFSKCPHNVSFTITASHTTNSCGTSFKSFVRYLLNSHGFVSLQVRLKLFVKRLVRPTRLMKSTFSCCD